MDFRLDRGAGAPARTRARVRRSARSGPHVMEWDEAQHFPMTLLPKLAALGLTGHPVSGGVRRLGACRPWTTASASRSWRASVPAIALSVAAHNGLCSAHICMFGDRGAEAALPAAAREGRGARRVGAHRGGRRQRRGRHADRPPTRQGDGWVINGSKNFITHGRDRRRDGGHGGDRPRRRATAASRRSSSSAARRA